MTLAATKTIDTGTPIFTYLSAHRQGIVAPTDKGYLLVKQIGDEIFNVHGKIKEGVSIDSWIEAQKKQQHSMQKNPSQSWRLDITELPTKEMVDEWIFDNVCETINGEPIEPDGTGADGPSWLVALGLM